ncbi:hypothetical protein BH09MYX1_BH09MYX1_05470 [soil metagenome]
MGSKPKRKGRPLLVAAAGIAFVSFVSCHEDRPVGNLRNPDPRPEPSTDADTDAEAHDLDAGSTMIVDTPPVVLPPIVDAAARKDASPKKDAGSSKDAGRPWLDDPVGNLRSPPAQNE